MDGIKTAIEIAKNIQDGYGALKEAEVKLKIANLISELVDAKIDISDIQQELNDKNIEIKSLKDRLTIKGKIEFDSPYYWIINDGSKDGPYCQLCYDKDKRLIRLYNKGYKKGGWVCKACKENYIDDNCMDDDPNTKYQWGGSIGMA